jgi:hypothetical protein
MRAVITLCVSLLPTFASMTKRDWRSTSVAMKLLAEPAIRSPSCQPVGDACIAVRPVTGHGAIFDGCRPVPDRQGILDLAKAVALQAGMARPADRPLGSQMRQQFLLQNTTGLNEQASVDRLVGHAHLRVIGMLSHEPACNLLWGPFARELGGYGAAKICTASQLAGFGTLRAIPGRLIRRGCAILRRTAIAPDLAADGRCGTMQGTRDGAQGLPGAQTSGDLLAFAEGQGQAGPHAIRRADAARAR